jgi:hypothetical protein
MVYSPENTLVVGDSYAIAVDLFLHHDVAASSVVVEHSVHQEFQKDAPLEDLEEFDGDVSAVIDGIPKE